MPIKNIRSGEKQIDVDTTPFSDTASSSKSATKTTYTQRGIVITSSQHITRKAAKDSQQGREQPSKSRKAKALTSAPGTEPPASSDKPDNNMRHRLEPNSSSPVSSPASFGHAASSSHQDHDRRKSCKSTQGGERKDSPIASAQDHAVRSIDHIFVKQRRLFKRLVTSKSASDPKTAVPPTAADSIHVFLATTRERADFLMANENLQHLRVTIMEDPSNKSTDSPDRQYVLLGVQVNSPTAFKAMVLFFNSEGLFIDPTDEFPDF